jgi:hypothetical protein
MISFFATHVDPASSTRAKISVHLRAQRLAPVTVEPVLDLMKARDIEVAPALNEYIEGKPRVDQLRSFLETYLSERQVSESDSKTVLDKVDSLGEFVAPEGAEVVYSGEEIRAAGQLGTPAKPGKILPRLEIVAFFADLSLFWQSFPWIHLSSRISRISSSVEVIQPYLTQKFHFMW